RHRVSSMNSSAVSATHVVCDICGSQPCRTPGFCQGCRDADARTGKGGATKCDPAALTHQTQYDQTAHTVCRTEKAQTCPKYISFACYQMTDKGLFKEASTNEQLPGNDVQKARPLFISGPFEILGRARNPNGESWARLLRFSDDDKRAHTVFIS